MTQAGNTGDAVWRYERTFEFPMPIEKAWQLFTDPVETSAWLLPFEENETGKMEATVEGQIPIALDVIAANRPHRLHTRMKGGNIPGATEAVTTFEATKDGTRIALLHLGFGDPEAWQVFGSSFARGWDEATADLILYVRTGVKYPRHIDDRRASIAAWPCRRAWGIEITEVFPGGFADQAGLRAGDVLIKLDRAGIYEVADIWTFTRVCKPGEEAEATYIRDGKLMRGTGRISRFEDFGE